MKERGMSATEMMVIGGMMAGAVLGFSRMVKNQSNALKNVYLKTEVQNIQNTIAELMRNEANCIATVKNSSATPPSFDSELTVPAIMQFQETNGTSRSIPFYETGKIYDGVKIIGMKIRSYNSEEDKTPAHKMEIEYQVSAKTVGTNSISTKMEFFFSPIASVQFPNYRFKCSAGGGLTSSPLIEPVEITAFLPASLTGVASIRSSTLDCPQGKRPVSCGFNDSAENSGEDSLTCHVDLLGNKCVATIDTDAENVDAVTFQCICL